MDTLIEFNKKYTGTWIRHKTNGEIHIGFVDGVDMDNNVILLSSGKLGTLTKKYPVCLPDFELDSPESGLFNHNGHALYLFKNPARQWQRGLCAANHEVYNPFKKLFKEGIYLPRFGRSLVDALYSNLYEQDIAKACHIMADSNERVYSIAITKQLMLSKSPSEKQIGPLIWFRTTPVGFLDRKFRIDDPLYQQEVGDELRRIGAFNWIS